jgi:hypothetical protein
MENKLPTEDEMVRRVANVLERIINENSESLSQKDFLVRPGYGYDKFYLNQIWGGSESSLQSLIHFILFDEKIYQEILTKNQYAKCLDVMKNNPETYYYPTSDSDEDIKLDDMLMFVYFRCVLFVGHKLVSMGLDVSHYFDEFLEGIDYKIEDGLKV